MTLDPKYITTLADATKFYYSDSELMELCTAFEVDLSYHLLSGVPHLAWVRSLLHNIDQGNNRRFLRTLVESLLSRAREGLANNGLDKRVHHQSMHDMLIPLEDELIQGGIPEDFFYPVKSPSTAWEEAREFLAMAGTEITIVDDRLGISTLDCLRDVRQHIRILTTVLPDQEEEDINGAMKAFRAEGHFLSVRCLPRLHDRYILFNNRCWLTGSSLSRTGEKGFNVIEIVDFKKQIYAEIADKWEEAAPLESSALGSR
jgi:hypothetical protein